MLSHLDLQDDTAVTAALHWSVVCADLLGGLTHALSNRLAFLTILSSELVEDAGAIEASADMLRGECTKLTSVLELFRLLARPGSRATAPAQSMSLAECLEQTVALLQHNLTGRETPLAVHGAAALPPVWGQPIQARYALITLLFAAQRDASTARAARMKDERVDEAIELRCRAERDAVMVEIGSPCAETASRRAVWRSVTHFARAAGAEVYAADGAAPPFGDPEYVRDGPIVFRMPTVRESDLAS